VIDSEHYTLEGRKYVRVTRVTGLYPRGEPFLRWIGRHGYEEAMRLGREAAQRGTAAHALVEQWISGPGNHSPWSLSAAATRPRIEFEKGHAEQRLWSQRHAYAGTADLIAPVGPRSRPAVIDWKTGKRLYREHEIQLSAYLMAWNEMHPQGPVIRDRLIVRLMQDGSKPEVKHLRGLSGARRDFKVFLNLLAVYRDMEVG